MGEGTDAGAEESSTGYLTRDRLLLVAVLAVGIAGSGLARRALGVAGYNDIGRAVFVLGYAGMVFALWYGWIRPLDITGP